MFSRLFWEKKQTNIWWRAVWGRLATGALVKFHSSSRVQLSLCHEVLPTPPSHPGRVCSTRQCLCSVITPFSDLFWVLVKAIESNLANCTIIVSPGPGRLGAMPSILKFLRYAKISVYVSKGLDFFFFFFFFWGDESKRNKVVRAIKNYESDAARFLHFFSFLKDRYTSCLQMLALPLHASTSRNFITHEITKR